MIKVSSLPAAVALFALTAALSTSRAEDRTARFLRQLRAEGHGDLVADFLDRAEANPLVSDEFRARVPLERVVARFADAVALSDPAKRLAALAELEPAVQKLAGRGGDASRLAVDLADRRATTEADVARRAAIVSARETSADDAARARKAAGDALRAAGARLGVAERLIAAERETLKGVQPASPEGRRRADLGARLALVRLLAARLVHEEAMTRADEPAERDRLNRQAAKLLGDLHAKYAKWGVGLYAHFYEGRCYRLLGDRQRAAAALEDLAAQPAPTPDLRRVVTLAHAELSALALEHGDLEKALGGPAEWLEGLEADETEGPEAATLRYHLALATLARASAEEGAGKRRLERDARELLGLAARVPSDVQADARDRWVALSASLGVERGAPKSFDEAAVSAAEALEAMAALDVSLADALDAERPAITEQRSAAAQAAYAALGQAVRFARDEKVDPEASARVRYQLAWLDWDRGDYARAASRAEYVARNDTSTESGEAAARLALAALERLERAGDAAATKKLREFTHFVSGRWADTAAGEAASALRLGDAIRSKDLAAARTVVEGAPAARRPILALRLAVARWEADRADADRVGPALAELAKAFTAASEGDAAPASPFVATAALYLADAALEAGDVARAESLLSDERAGPLARVAAGIAPGDNPQFATAALRSHARVAAMSGRGADAALELYGEKVAQTSSDPGAAGRAWLALAVTLLADLDRRPDRAGDIAACLTRALERAASGVGGADWNTRLWLAQAHLRCGEALNDKARARASLVAGRDGFAALVASAAEDPGLAPTPAAALAARLRLARCHRELGDYERAVDAVAELLASSAAVLEAQRFAAEALQAWGVAERDAARLEESIAGARPGSDGKNLVWGWSKLAAVAGRFAAGDAARRQLYFDAWREVARSRYEAALLAEGPPRADQLRKAASTLVAVQRKNPDLGGEENRRAYDELLKQIQRAAGLAADGLSKAGGGG